MFDGPPEHQQSTETQKKLLMTPKKKKVVKKTAKKSDEDPVILIAVAPPGGGKNTFMKHVLIRNGFDPALLPMSDALRSKADSDPDLVAEMARSKDGYLVDDKYAVPCMLSALDVIKGKKFWYLDGVLRTMLQLYAFIGWLESNGLKNAKIIVVYLDTDPATCGYRIALRAIEESRQDDKGGTKSLLVRMEEFRRWTMPVVEHLELQAPTLGWKFFRFMGNDILGTAQTLYQVLHLPASLKSKARKPAPKPKK